MLDLEDFLPYRLSVVSNLVSQGIATTYQNSHDLTVTEWRIIAVLGRFPGIAAAAVVERTAMDKVAVSRAVRRLLERALIERCANDSDRRCLDLYLSDKGRKIYDQVAPAALEFERRLLEALSNDEQAALEKMLEKLGHAAVKLGYD